MKNMKNAYHLGTVIILLGTLFTSTTAAHASSIITVNTTESSATVDGNCDIREALQAADSDTPVDACPAGSGADTIAFNIPGAGLHTIVLNSGLVTAFPVAIDGTTQPGYTGTPLIQLDADGVMAAPLITFDIGAEGSSMKGLMLTHAIWNAVVINCDNVTVSASYLNTDGSAEIPSGSNAAGVLVFKANNATIGGSTAADRNLFSGNTGVQIDGGSNNLVQGNYFGLRADGLTPITNQTVNASAILLEINSGLIPANNVLRGNVITTFPTGIELTDKVNNTTIAGNYIGVGKDGSTQLATGDGILLYGSSNNTIGGSSPADRNVISGNTSDNILLNNNGVNYSNNNLIYGNYIGTDATGLNLVGSSTYSVRLLGGDANAIGDMASGVGNLIAGGGDQIYAQNSTNIRVKNNKLGTNINGTAPLGAPTGGVILYGSTAQFTNNWITNDSINSIMIDNVSTITGTSSNNCFINNGTNGLVDGQTGSVADFTANWWGSATGPTESANPAGTGDIINPDTGNVNYSAFLTAAPLTCTPGVGLSAPSLAFGNQLLGTTGALKTITLTNTGGKGLTFTSVATSAPYSIAGTSTCPTAGGILSPGASCTLNIAFKPAALGAAPRNLVITTDAASSPNTVTLSGIGVAGTQLLKNASFETDTNHDKKPDGWVMTGFNPLTDGRVCDVKKTGACSFKLVGNQTLKTASQTILKTGLAGDDFSFGLLSKAAKVPAAATYRLTVAFYHGATLIGTQTLNFTKGTHTFTKVSGVFTAPGPYTKLVFKITYKAASGAVWFDPASLTWAP